MVYSLMSHVYTVKLTAQQFDTTESLAEKGYFPHSFFIEPEQFWSEDESEVTIAVPEHIAWDLLEHDKHSLYTCMSDELVEVWEMFKQEIV